jgi:uncharacterized protein (TIGR03118 family)
MVLRPTHQSQVGREAAPVSNRHRGQLLLGLIAAGALAMAAMPLTVTAHSDEDNRFVQSNQVSDVPGWAPLVDPSLVNAWGMSFGPTTPLWVSNNGSDSSTLYNGVTTFAKVPLTVSVPDGAPTGQVFNPGTDFMVNGAPAKFIFASENGFIDAWRGGLTPATDAVNVVTTPNAVYKGLAISTGVGGSWLYAANFHSGAIDVFNGSWVMQSWPGAFMDSRIPKGYAPFNIQNLGGMLYVTYAKQDSLKHDDDPGAGHGFVDVYDTSGNLVKRLVRRGRLDSPWGIQIAPKGFGKFGGDLLVGNFGNGKINAYNVRNGEFEGTLHNAKGGILKIDGLWGLQFGNGVAATPTTLIFTAGPEGESHGLLGILSFMPDHDH